MTCTHFSYCSAAQFSRAISSSGCDEWNLDLSGRFGDGGILLPRLVHTSTQTSVSDVETPAVHVWAPVDQATSTEGCIYLTVELLIEYKV